MANNISVALTADDREYQRTLKSATAAADRFAKSVGNAGNTANQSFSNLTTTLNNVNTSMTKFGSYAALAADKMSTLGTAIAGVGLATFISNILQGAAATKDISEAFGISVEKALELEAGFRKAGKGTNEMVGALSTFVGTIEEARNGSAKAQVILEKFGITSKNAAPGRELDAFRKMAEVMRDNAGNADIMTAAIAAGGKQMKGFVATDFLAGLDAAAGKQSELAANTIKADEAQKKIEASAIAVRNAFLNLLGPAIEEFNKFTLTSEGASTAARALGAALLVIAGSATITALRSVVGAVTALTGVMFASAVATKAEATALGGLTANTMAHLAVKQAENAAKANSLALSLAEAKAAQANAVSKAEQALATDVVQKLTWRYAAAQANAAAATAAHTAATGINTVALGANAVAQSASAAGMAAYAAQVAAAGGTLTIIGETLYKIGFALGSLVASITAAFTSWATFSAAVIAAGAALLRFAGLAAAAVAVVVGLNEAVKAAFDVDPIDFFAGKLESLTYEYFPGLYEALEKVGAWFGMAPGKIAKTADAMNKLPKPGDQTPAETQRLQRQAAPQALGTTIPGAASDFAKPWLAQEASLKAQYDLQRLTNTQAQKRLELQLQLVGAGEAEKTAALARYDAEAKAVQEKKKLDGEILKLGIQISQGGAEAAKQYGGQLAIMKQQRKSLDEQVDVTAAITAQIAVQNDLTAMSKMYTDLQVKAKQQLLDMDGAIADFNRSEDDRKLAAIQRQINAEAELAVKKRQDQLGNVPITDEEALSIMNRVKESYTAVIAKRKELSAAEKENEAYRFGLDLQNNAMLEGIKLTAEMAKLTQTTDQQRITDLRTQLELMAQQEIMKRQAALGRGQTLDQKEQDAIRKKVMDTGQAVITTTQAAIDKSREFSTGWEASYNKFADDAANQAQRAAREFDILTNGITDALLKMVQGGKLSFKDLANSLIAEFARSEIKNLLSNIMPKSSGGGSILGGLFGMAKNFLFPGAATGGHISGPTIVGENGPELFTPRSSGYVTPNNQLGMNNTNITQVTYSISAVDAPSFKALVARDPEFLLNVTEQARRNLPSRSRR